ncbi:HEPN domain-containing protein [Rhodopseudomonas telluris]|uniref:HEPN domain-containing protein n=1 Tax=Rhodopseudomonas telluris TaxID=644215 RepID=A0ABV6EM89_9BRAD
MNARIDFYSRIELIRDLSDNPLLMDTFPHNDAHNTRAAILRNGLVVSAFSLLESYLQRRVDETIVEMQRSQIGYSMLGEKLRKLLSLDAIIGLATRLGFTDKAERLAFAEANIVRLAGGPALPINYTGLGFSPKGSNVSGDDIQTLLAAFGVQSPWQCIGNVISSLGATRLSARDDFLNFARARNKAAHDSTTNIATSDLKTYLDTALLVGMASDIIVTNAVAAFVSERTPTSATNLANALPLSYRFLDRDQNGLFKEKVSTIGRTIRLHPDKESAVSSALRRARRLTIVVRDSRATPIELI